MTYESRDLAAFNTELKIITVLSIVFFLSLSNMSLTAFPTDVICFL